MYLCHRRVTYNILNLPVPPKLLSRKPQRLFLGMGIRNASAISYDRSPESDCFASLEELCRRIFLSIDAADSQGGREWM